MVAEGKRLHIYRVPGNKGILGNEIADDIAKNAIRLSTKPVTEIRKSLKTIHDEVFEMTDRRIKVRWMP